MHIEVRDAWLALIILGTLECTWQDLGPLNGKPASHIYLSLKKGVGLYSPCKKKSFFVEGF